MAVQSEPRPVPAIPLVASDGRGMIFPAPGKPLLVEFIYTSCPTICTSLGQEFLQIQRALARRGLTDRVHLISLSFDLARDMPTQLAEYARLHAADPVLWTVARPRHDGDLRTLLATFGVTVVPDTDDGYVHNAAIHYVDASGRLARIFDMGDVEAILSLVESSPS